MRKYYSPSKIKEIIESRKYDIECAQVGMDEDWFWTGETVYEDGEYLKYLGGETIEIAGIDSSYWATPVMRVYTKNRESLVFPVWFEKEEE